MWEEEGKESFLLPCVRKVITLLLEEDVSWGRENLTLNP